MKKIDLEYKREQTLSPLIFLQDFTLIQSVDFEKVDDNFIILITKF